MKQNNPGIIPRNHRVEEALSAAVDRNDYSVMEALLNAITRPYAYLKEQEAYAHSLSPQSALSYFLRYIKLKNQIIIPKSGIFYLK